jgi:hypothetical protein
MGHRVIIHFCEQKAAMGLKLFEFIIHEHVRFEVFTAVTMKNGVFWVVTPCGSCKSHTV